MTLLDVERIKFFSTRSPWWCSALAVAVSVLVAGLIAAFLDSEFVTTAIVQSGTSLGSYVVLVMAALAVTTEYRFGTIRASFLAVPNRLALLGAKTAFVVLISAFLGLVAAFLAWGIGTLLAPDANLELLSRGTLGYGLFYAGFALIAVAVGLLVRQTAGAVAILLVWAFVVETVVGILDFALETSIAPWMPFGNATNFVTAGAGAEGAAGPGAPVMTYPFGPWGSLGYFLAIAFALLAVSLVVAQRRDA